MRSYPIWRLPRPRVAGWILALAVCLLATGCGTTSDAHISLKPPSTPSFGPRGSVAPTAAPTAITLVRPQDMRTQTRTLGGLHQVFQQDVFSDKDPVEWVGDSLASAFQQAGYAVRRADTVRAATTSTVVAPAVTETGTRCVAQLNGWRCTTVIAANIEIYKNAERVSFAGYKGEYSDTFFTLALPTSSQYESTFDGAMKEFLTKAIPGINSVISSAPETANSSR